MSVLDDILAVCILIALAVTVYVCAMDAKRRGKSPFLVALLVVFFFPLGMLIWMIFRPEIKDENGTGKQFKLDKYRAQ
ncbi:MAG: hypothetical protein WB608_10985 [Terracidiphilus sp.]